ncbi:MAG: hypothetical protein ABJN62_13495 [Halioglobus sp.]
MTDQDENQGRYRYYLNGDLAEIDETWQCERLPCGQFNVRSSRKVSGLTIDVQATVGAVGTRACKVSWSATGRPVIAASYEVDGDRIAFMRSVGPDATHNSSHLPVLNGASVLYPLMRVFTGPAIRQIAEQGGEGTVLVPSISSPDHAESLLLPDISTRAVTALGECQLTKMNGEAVNCTLWQFVGGQYGNEARFWLNENDLLQRYCWDQSDSVRWDVHLA